MPSIPIARLTLGSAVDVLAVAVALFFLLRGLLRGASGEIARILGFIGGASAGYSLYPAIRTALTSAPGQASPAALSLTALALAVVTGLIAGLTVRFVCIRLLQIVILQPADAVLGAAAGAVYAAVLLAIVFSLGMLVPHPPVRRVFAEQSAVGRLVCPWLRTHMGMAG